MTPTEVIPLMAKPPPPPKPTRTKPIDPRRPIKPVPEPSRNGK